MAEPPRLALLFGPKSGVTYEVSRRLVAGRAAECDIFLLDDKVSRAHCAFAPVGDGVEQSDLGSRNGTWHNGQRLTRSVILGRGDTVALGETLLVVGPDVEVLHRAHDDATLVLQRGEAGATSSASGSPSDEVLSLAGRLLLEGALRAGSAGLASMVEGLARALGSQAVACLRSAEGALRAVAAWLRDTTLFATTALAQACIQQHAR